MQKNHVEYNSQKILTVFMQVTDLQAPWFASENLNFYRVRNKFINIYGTDQQHSEFFDRKKLFIFFKSVSGHTLTPNSKK